MLLFEWNEEKNKINTEKHGLAFTEAKEAFYDDYSLEIYDESHSDIEDRFFHVGMIKSLRIVCIAYCIRKRNVIRIISARFATKKETIEYEKRKI